MIRIKIFSKKDEDGGENVVMSSLSELILFLLFFFLILLGDRAVYDAQPAQSVEDSSNTATPVFTLSEADRFSFARGSFRLTDEFRSVLSKNVIPRILEIIDEAEGDISAIEVIGHTDKNKFVKDGKIRPASHQGNLDSEVLDVLDMKDNALQRLKVDDNAGLGLARALAVRDFLLRKDDFGGLPVHAYSASFTVRLDNRSASSRTVELGLSLEQAQNRRRIEIRLRGPLEEVQ